MAQPARLRIPPFGESGKLDGSNYPLWKFKMKAILSAYELWDTATGADVRPVARPDPANAGQHIAPTADEIQAWTRRDADALCSIVCSVSDSVMALIQHVTTAEEAWTVLKNQYETTNQTRIQNLENQLANERLVESENAKKIIKRVKNLHD